MSKPLKILSDTKFYRTLGNYLYNDDEAMFQMEQPIDFPDTLVNKWLDRPVKFNTYPSEEIVYGKVLEESHVRQNNIESVIGELILLDDYVIFITNQQDSTNENKVGIYIYSEKNDCYHMGFIIDRDILLIQQGSTIQMKMSQTKHSELSLMFTDWDTIVRMTEEETNYKEG